MLFVTYGCSLEVISFILWKKGELNGLCSCEKAGKLLREWLPPCIYSVVEV